MGNYNQDGDNKGGFRPAKRDFGRKKSWGGQSFGDRQTVMHPAVCSNCGKDCEVPFRPTNGKPVYCKECFGDKKNSDRGGERPQRNDFENRPQPKPHYEGGKGNDEVKKQLQEIHTKLDRLMQTLDSLTQKKPSQEIAKNINDNKEKKSIKKVVKKSAKKAKK